MRIIAFDEFQVVYDVWWDGLGWGMMGHSRASFYSDRVSNVIGQPRLRIEPLTEKERLLFRPELPLRLCRHRNLNWAQLETDSPDELAEKLPGLGVDPASLPSIFAPSINLLFVGPSYSSPMRHDKVLAGEGGSITATELLWRAGQLFARQELTADDGIGLYRAGVVGGLPAYLMSGYHHFSTWQHEEGTDLRLFPGWHTRRKAVGGTYPQRLKAMRRQFPFKQWRAGEKGGLEQYSKENCTAMAAIFDKLLKRLIALGEGAAEADKLAAFKEAIEATNALNAREMNLIETGEREQLCELCNEIARATGLDPAQYGGGEGPASQWRDW